MPRPEGRTEIMDAGPPPHRRLSRPARRALVAVCATAGAVAVAVGLSALPDGGRAPAGPSGSASSASSSPSSPAASVPDRPPAVVAGPDAVVAEEETPGLVVAGAPAGGLLDRRDRSAASGPWSVVLRRPGGTLATGSVVITYPVAGGAGAAATAAVTGRGGDGSSVLTWPLGPALARARGTAGREELAGLARATRLADGRPRVVAPPGWSTVADGPSRPAVVREARYPTADLGEASGLDAGLTFTQVLRGGGLEDVLLAGVVVPAGTVHGRPAVLTTTYEGNAALVWEPAPGVVVCVGYSGAQYSPTALAALRRIAARTRLISSQDWNLLGPSTIDQSNTLG